MKLLEAKKNSVGLRENALRVIAVNKQVAGQHKESWGGEHAACGPQVGDPGAVPLWHASGAVACSHLQVAQVTKYL